MSMLLTGWRAYGWDVISVLHLELLSATCVRIHLQRCVVCYDFVAAWSYSCCTWYRQVYSVLA